ncbi:hypothetical protein ABKN59_009474, partial [Abortiporus biennis]
MSIQYDYEMYTDEMSRLGKGIAMCKPEMPRGRGIQIGDVGYIDKGSGEFSLLFNALAIENAGFLRSSAVSEEIVGGDAEEKVKFSISSKNDYGAVLYLEKTAVEHRVKDNDSFKNYMNKNYKHWIDFAKRVMDVTLTEEQLLLVDATTTTNKLWSMTAWSSRSQTLEFTVGPEMSSSPTVSVVPSKVPSDQEMEQTSWLGRVGSYTKRSKEITTPFKRTRADITDPTFNDHCIFISAYKLKHRRFRRYAEKAGAGFHKLPDGGGGSPGSGSSPNVDPHEAVLNYILEHSKANIAITSASDISAFYRGSDWPEDVAADLASRQPEVETSRDGKYAYLSMTAAVKNDFAERQRERAEKCINYIATNEDFKLGGVDSRTQSLIDEATILLPGASAPRQWQSRVL